MLTFSASVNAFTASQTTTNATTSAQFTTLGVFSASVNAFSASQIATNAVLATATASFAAFNANVTVFTSSQIATNAANATQLANLNAFSGTVYTFTASLMLFTASQNTTNSSFSSQLSSLAAATASIYLFDTNVSAFTGSQITINSSLNLFSSSVNTFTASLNAFTASVNTFSASQLTTTTNNTAQISALNSFTSELRTYLFSLCFDVLDTLSVVAAITGALDVRYVSSSNGLLPFDMFVSQQIASGGNKALLFTDAQQTADINPYYAAGSVSITHQYLNILVTGALNGYTQLSTTTGATNSSFMIYNYSCLPGRFKKIRARVEFFLPQLSNSGSDQFQIYIGQFQGAGQRKYLSLQYNDNQNGGRSQIITNNSNSGSDTGISPVANKCYAFEYYMVPNGIPPEP